MRRLGRLAEVALDGRLVGLVDATLLCLGFTVSVASALPTLHAFLRGLTRLVPLHGD